MSKKDNENISLNKGNISIESRNFSLRMENESLKEKVSSLKGEVEEKNRIISELMHSLSWKVTGPLRKAYDSLRSFFPEHNPLNGLKRIKFLAPVSSEVTGRENSSGLLDLSSESSKEQVNIAPRETKEVIREEPQIRPRRAIVISEASTLIETEPYNPVADWQNYLELSEKARKNREARIRALKLSPEKIISLKEEEIPERAKALEFPCVDEPLVSIVIPVYNNLKYTLECLITILDCTKDLKYEVIIVDDGSSDATGEVLPQIKGLIYVKNPKNLGFVRTCNEGGSKARGKYTLFLNNDVQVTEGWLSELVGTFDEFSGVGAVGPKVIYPNGRLQEAGVFINSDCTSHMIGLTDDPDLPRYNYIKEVEYCSGVCLLLETNAFREMGGFDEKFAPSYCEDMDLCLGIRNKGLRIFYNPRSVIIHHLSVTSNKLGDDYKMQCITANQQKISEKWQAQIDDFNQVRIIAFYLPQFHPIPENDLWWGKGFTEWRNVSKARPNFRGHLQPRLPADLGFYDLRSVEVMEEQARLARRYGIHGFCFYYYWFNGKRLLEMPLERMLESNKPDIPFCLCWANENWSRRWDGRERDVLLEQTYSEEDDRKVIFDLIRYMRHPNYIRVNGMPLLIVYRINLFPDIQRTTRIWRRICMEEGIGEIYLVMAESFENTRIAGRPSEFGFNASVEFPPHGCDAEIKAPGDLLNPNFKGRIFDYRETVLRYLEKPLPDYVRFRTAMLSWDNTARRQNESHIFAFASPGGYQAWLENILTQTREQNFGDERLVFINAWNEWAEGTHMEPDQHFGHGYLQATRNAKESCFLRANNQH